MAGKGGNPELASNLFPDDQAEDVPPDVTLSWSPGEFAGTHDVYLGTSFEDVNSADRNTPLSVLISQGQDANSYDPSGLLALNQTYYWRIDEVNATPDNTIFRGPVWSFTTEPVAYPLVNVSVTASSEGALSPAVNVVNGSGLTDGQHGVDSGTMWLSAPNGEQPTWIQFEFDRAYKLNDIQIWNQNQSVEARYVA